MAAVGGLAQFQRSVPDRANIVAALSVPAGVVYSGRAHAEPPMSAAAENLLAARDVICDSVSMRKAKNSLFEQLLAPSRGSLPDGL